MINKNNFTYYYVIGFLQKHYNTLRGSKKILDVGCGVGSLVLYLSNIFSYLLGIDVSDKAIDIANTAKKNNNIQNIDFKNKSLNEVKTNFDLVLCTEVIEHIDDDKDFISSLSNRLNESGYLVISTPSDESFFYKKGFFTNFDKRVGHIRRYNINSLTKKLNNGGFRVVDYGETDGILRMILFSTDLEFIVRFIKGPLVPIFHFFDFLSKKIFGSCGIILLAQKK